VANPWSGITVRDLEIGSGGTVSFVVGPRHTVEVPGTPKLSDVLGPVDYPDSYKSPARFIKDQRTAIRDPDAPSDARKVEWYCFTCSFRPWADTGDASEAAVTFVTPGGRVERSPAVLRNGRWVSTRQLGPGETAVVGAGCVQDPWGNYNGAESARVARDTPSGAAIRACQTDAVPLGGGRPCGRDRLAPRSIVYRRYTRLTRRGIRAAGRSRDRDCRRRLTARAARNRGRVSRVYLAVARFVPHGCRWLTPHRHFLARRSCRRPVFVGRARVRFSARRHYSTWRFSRRVRLPHGLYAVIAYGVDPRRNRESKRRRARALHLRRR
jgi:hypothetical protein